MRNLKFGHTADIHLGYRQYGFQEREQDFCDAFGHVTTRTIDMKLDALIIAGDIFDMPKPPAHIVRFLVEQVRRLQAAGIVVLGIDGNHDVTNGNWLRVCGITVLEPGEVTVLGGVSIVGLHGMRPTLFHKYLDEMVANGTKADVFVLHQALGEMADFDAQEITALELAPKLTKLGVKYVAMGDIHSYKEMVMGGIRFVYPGSTEVNKIDEVQDKTFSIVQVGETPEGEAQVQTALEPIRTRPILEMNLRAEADLDTLLSKLNGIDPLAILWYERENKELAQRAEIILRDKNIMHRICPMSAANLDGIATQLARQQFERKGALLQLKDAVGAFFEESSEEYELVFQMLDSPDSVNNTVEQYLRTKGVK